MKIHNVLLKGIAGLLFLAIPTVIIGFTANAGIGRQCGEAEASTAGTIEYPMEASYGSCVWRPGTFRFIDITTHLGNRVYFTDLDAAAFHIYNYNSNKKLEFVKRLDLSKFQDVDTITGSLIYNSRLFFYSQVANWGKGDFYELVNDSSFENRTDYIEQEIKNHWEGFHGNISQYIPDEYCQKLTGKQSCIAAEATILKHSNGCYYVFLNRVQKTGEKQSDLEVYDQSFQLKFTKKYEETGITTVYDVAEDSEGNIYIADSCGSLATKLSPEGKVLAQKECSYTSGHGGLTVLEDGNILYAGSNVSYQVNILDKKLNRVSYCGGWSYQEKGDFLNAGYVTGDSSGNTYILDGVWQNSPFNGANDRVSVYKGEKITLYKSPDLGDIMDATSSKYDGNVYYINHANWRSDTAGGDIAFIDQKKNQYVQLAVKGYKYQEFKPIRLAVSSDGSIYSYNSNNKLYRLTRSKNSEMTVKKTVSNVARPLKMDCDSEGKLYMLNVKTDTSDYYSNQLCIDVYDKDLKQLKSIVLGEKSFTSLPYRSNYSEENGLISQGKTDYPIYSLFGVDLNDQLYYMDEEHHIIRLDLKTMSKETVQLENMIDTPYTWTDLYGNIYSYLAYDGTVQYDQAVYKFANPDSKVKMSTETGSTAGVSSDNSDVLKIRSKEEIKKAWAKYYKPYSKDKYLTKPSISSPYNAGVLNDKFIKEGVAATNLVRYIAGLPDDIVSEAELNKEAQYGAVLLSKTGKIDHNPIKPADMDEDFYNIAVEATQTSNLYIGVENFTQSIFGYMTELANVTQNSVGHRRWLLNPKLAKVGFEWAGNASVMKIFDESRTNSIDYDYIGYPSKGYYPTELFDGCAVWSVQPNPERYDSSKLDDIKVTMRDVSSNKKVTVKLLGVDNNGQGIPYCISFVPEKKLSIKDGKAYEISISGLKDKMTNSETKITYQTEFFNVEG